MSEDLAEDAMCLINENYMARAANKHRQKSRPAEPKGIDFDLDVLKLPDGFLRKDIVSVEGAQAEEPERDILCYTMIEGGTRRGGNLLVDSDGFTYVVKGKPGPTCTPWRCSVRGKTRKCPASVKQVGHTFTPGLHPHNHEGDPGCENKV